MKSVLGAGLAAGLVACQAPVTSVGAWAPDAGIDATALVDASLDVAAEAATTGFYIEAESGVLSGGFTIGDSPAASGGEYIESPAGVTSLSMPGPATAVYPFVIPTAGSYLVWGRIHSPDAEHNTLWVQVDGGAWTLWRISTGDVFWWDAVHEDTHYGQGIAFDLSAGSHQLVVASAADTVQLDRLYLTADGDEPPGNAAVTTCDPPNSIPLDGGCSISCGSQGGNACSDDLCQGLPTIDAYDCAICCHVAQDQ